MEQYTPLNFLICVQQRNEYFWTQVASAVLFLGLLTLPKASRSVGLVNSLGSKSNSKIKRAKIQGSEGYTYRI